MRRRVWHRQVGEVLAAEPGPIRTRWPTTSGRRGTSGPRCGWCGRGSARSGPTPGGTPPTALMPLLPRSKGMRHAPASGAGCSTASVDLLRVADPARGITYLEEAGRVAAAVEDPVLAAYALVDRGMLRCFLKDLRRGLAEMEAGTDALDALPAASVHAGGRYRGLGGGCLARTCPRAGDGQDRPPAPGVNLRRGALVVWLACAGCYAEAEAMGSRSVGRGGEGRAARRGRTLVARRPPSRAGAGRRGARPARRGVAARSRGPVSPIAPSTTISCWPPT